MMDTLLLQAAIAVETDIVAVRKRTRRLAELLAFDAQDQTRITTAVSEIARNAYEYARGGHVEFRVTGEAAEQRFIIAVRDRGPGIADLDGVLSGSRKSATGMGVGLLGARRLMDTFDIKSGASGTRVVLGRRLPPRAEPLTAARIRSITDQLAADGPGDAMEEIRRQNQQILMQLDELRARQEDLERLNQELQDTNRGVVALYAELDERADHLRRADELKSRFLSHMSHEFRTPLNSILALSKLLLARSDGPLTSEQETQVGFIRKAVENLTELVDDLLDLAKVEAGKTPVSASPFTASSLFGALRGMLRPLLVGDAVALIFDEPHTVPPLDTDEAKVSQILRNFISNALKFTEQGEVRVWASADAAADTVSFHVRDTGIGLDPDDIDVIFQEFGQVANRLQHRVKGTGLGLPLARKFAELLGGRITVQSSLGHGSTFTVTLPRIYGGAEADDGVLELEVAPGRVPVLVVEDEPADAHAIRRILASSMYQPLLARTVREATRVMHAVRPEAILLDVLLLGDETWRLLLRFRSGDTSADIPLIVLSGTGEDRKALHLGADAYMSKPVDGDTLLALLDRVTGRRSRSNLLLVYDEEVTHYLVRQLLPRGKYRLSVATSVEACFDQIVDQRPDVVLLDLAVPQLNGHDFLARLHADAATAGLPVVVLTPHVPDADQCATLGRNIVLLAKSALSSKALTEAIEQAQRARQPLDAA